VYAHLIKTLDKYIDFSKLKKRKIIQDYNNNNNNNELNAESNNSNNNFTPRLIITCADIQKGEPVVFDSNNIDIDAEHDVASTGYAIYVVLHLLVIATV
jgi:hypothetical protein